MAKPEKLKLLLVMILLVGVILRVGYVLTLPGVPTDPDEHDYIQSALGILHEGSFAKTVYYHVPPVVPIVYAGLFALTGPNIVAIRVFQSLLFVVLGLIVFELGKETSGSLAGLLAASFAAVYPYFIFFSGQAMTETIATVVIAAALLFGARSVRTKRKRDVLAFGVLLAIATLTRAAVVYFVLAIPMGYLIAWGIRNMRWLLASLVAVVGFLVVYSPWVVVNYRYFGVVLPSPTIGGGVMLYQTALKTTIPDDAKRMEFLKREVFPKYYYPKGATYAALLAGDRYLSKQAVQIIKENPGAYARIALENLERFWQLYPHQSKDAAAARWYRLIGLTSFGILVPFFITGLVEKLFQFRRLSLLYGFMVYFTMVHSLLYGKLRYRVPMDTLYLVFAAAGMVYWARRVFPRAIEDITGHSGIVLRREGGTCE